MTARDLGDGYVLRRVRDGDSSDLIRLLAHCFAEYEGCVLDVDGEEPELRAPATLLEHCWVIEHGGRAVGCVALRSSPRTDGGSWVELKKCYLDRAARGRGLGRVLVERVLEHARAVDAAGVELWSDTRFTTAHAVYERLGFRRTGGHRELWDLSCTEEWHFERLRSRPEGEGGDGG